MLAIIFFAHQHKAAGLKLY